jgi:hypothetical protein
MPYNSAEATKPITVIGVTVKYEISPGPPWTAGQTITMKATVTKNGTPFAGTRVWFSWGNADTGSKYVGNAITDANGVATFTWTIPWTFTGPTGTSSVPCKTNVSYAVEETSGASAMVSGKVAYPTRISISAPDSVIAGQSFTIKGMLVFESDKDVWSGLPGRTVSLFYNGTKIADVTTASDGTYSATASIPTSGSYTLKAVYSGEGFTATAAAFLGLTVSPEAETALSVALPLVVGAIVAFASLKAGR